MVNFDLDGVRPIMRSVHEDERGRFVELHNSLDFSFIDAPLIQTNWSYSRSGVFRGLHAQLDPHAQGKLITVMNGQIIDFVVDLRRGETFGDLAYYKLDNVIKDGLRSQLWIPPGFAHGFYAVTDCEVMYQCTHEYRPESQITIRYDDIADVSAVVALTNIGLSRRREYITSEKDRNGITLKEYAERYHG